MSNIVTDLGENFNWKAYKAGVNTFTITCTNGGSAFNLTSYVFTLRIRKSQTSTDLLTLTQGSGITNGGASGIITITLSETQSNTTLPGDTYFYELTYVVASEKKRMIQGILTLSRDLNPSSSATSLSATINMGGVNVSATITLGISSASIAAALGVQTANAVYAGPSSGASANPAFRALVIADVPKVIQLACSDETTALTAGTGKITFRMPHAMTVTAVRASLTTAQATGVIFTVDINENGVSILSTKLTIDNTEKTSTTAVTAPVISDTSLADDAEITVDIDQVGDGTAKGLKILLIGS